jgi:hypothetical protein
MTKSDSDPDKISFTKTSDGIDGDIRIRYRKELFYEQR